MRLNLSMWKNENKRGEKSPDYFLNQYDKDTGQSTKYGAGWIRKTNSGKQYVSLVIEKDEGNRGGNQGQMFTEEVKQDSIEEGEDRTFPHTEEDENRVRIEDIPF